MPSINKPLLRSVLKNLRAVPLRRDYSHRMMAPQEMLDYPLCCVQDPYHRSALLKRTYYSILQRIAGGDVPEMERLIREDVQLGPATPEEQAMLDDAREFRPKAFTSINMCAACAADPT